MSSTKVARSFSKAAAACVARSVVVSMPLRFQQRLQLCTPSSASGCIRRYCWLNHLVFSGSKRAPPLCTRREVERAGQLFHAHDLLVVPGFQPSKASMLMKASG
jgi:hypothetical protein